MLLKAFFILLFFSICIYFNSCGDNVILIPKPCTEEPDISFTSIELKLITDTTSSTMITVDRRGEIFGNGLLIKQNGIFKNAKIGGHICKDKLFYIDVLYNDTLDNSRLRIEGGIMLNNFLSGQLYYCSNLNNNCTFILIGSFNGSFSGSNAAGSFTSPEFSGQFETTDH